MLAWPDHVVLAGSVVFLLDISVLLLVLPETHVLDFAWSSLIILGTGGTIALALAFSAPAPGRSAA